MSTKKQIVLSMLQEHSEGVTKEDLKVAANTTDSSIYSIANALRRQGFKIKNDRNRYILKSPKEPTKEIIVHQASQQSVSPSKAQSKLPNGLTLKEMESVSRLSSSDKDDYYEMIKKSIFYKLSAEAILTANSVVDGFRQLH